MSLQMTEFETPLGAVTMATDGARVCALTFSDRWASLAARLARAGLRVSGRASGVPDAERRVRDYFAGHLQALDGIAVAPPGTAFQQAVWAALRAVPPGRTTTYGALARAVGRPAAVRAVGAANGANPVWLIIPCHRAIGSGGDLVGYGGGLERKRWLLAHEGATIAGSPDRASALP